MHQIESTYQQAVQHTKNRVREDMEKFLGESEEIPSFYEYLAARKTYLQQIWLNVWLTKSTNDTSRRDKKAFLSEHGFEVEGIDRKLINKLFRNEMRGYRPFDVLSWLERTKDEQWWNSKYRKARKQFLKKQDEERILQEKMVIREQISEYSGSLLNKYQDLFYLKIRSLIAKDLLRIFQHSQKYEKIEAIMLEEELTEAGPFLPNDYKTLSDFFEELTGSVHQVGHWGKYLFEYETYFYYFEERVSDSFGKIGSEQVFINLPEHLKRDFETVFQEKLTQSELMGIIQNDLNDFIPGFLFKLGEEYVEDLIRLAGIPFDEKHHLEIYERDLADRDRKRAEELAKIERQKEEKARMMEDIFGQEYNPSQRRNVRYYLHIGETNTGKTHHALERMKAAKSGLYLAPLRLLALEVFEKLNGEGIPCSLKTGEEEKFVDGSAHISCTVEMFHEKDYYDVIVIDESQMIADKDRGFSWYKAITRANATEVHIIGSLNIKEIMLGLLREGEIEIIEYSRDVPLEVESKEFTLGHVKKGDALVCFSRRKVLENASKLQNSGHKVSMIYGSMPPETRKKQIERFIRGETAVVVATDAIGMGLNLPIRRIVFLENEKFDGTRRRRLTSQEVKQIAGRAGRKGLYNVGRVAFSSDIKLMKKLLLKDDEPVANFSIAPTAGIFERFQKHYRSLSVFFELWDQFESPKGTEKASLSEERELYQYVKETEMEARLPMMELYGFLHLPFTTREPALIEQWLETLKAIVSGLELPEPIIKTSGLEELELSYKAIGLHLLFLYKLGKRTEAIYWERIRTGLSDDVHEYLNSEVKNYKKKCRHCGKGIHEESSFQICDSCHSARYRNRSYGRSRRR